MIGASRISVWLRYVAVAVGYALGYSLLRQVSWSHWVLFAGFRLSVLLLVPYRYWPALALGEMVPIGYTSLDNLDMFGPLWSAVMIVPPIALAMPVVKYFRERGGLRPGRGPVRITPVLTCAMLVSVVWTLTNMAAVAVAIIPAGMPQNDYRVFFARWILGNYLGILTLVPLALMARNMWSCRPAGLHAALAQVFRSRLLLDTCIFLLPLLGLLAWIGLDASENSRQTARILMFLPVVGLALRHGWHGAALGGTVASLVVAATMPALYDSATMQSELFIAFAITTMLLFGNQISVLSYKGGQRSVSANQALALARRLHDRNEARLRRTARAIESINETVRVTEEAIFNHIRKLEPEADTAALDQHAGVISEKLSDLVDGLQPLNLDRHGLIATLRHGGLARTLDNYGVSYRCRGHGRIGELSKSMQLDIHRLVCEAVSQQCSQHSVGELSVRVRSGVAKGRRWVVVQIDAFYADEHDFKIRGGYLLYRLAATGHGLDAIRDAAALYEGRARTYAFEDGERMSIMLHEPVLESGQVASVADATAAFISSR